jgi:threonine dehydrogenase-like Zn-dependent dehydrogenase
MTPLLKMIESRKIDPTFVITHRMSLDEAPKGYEIFNDKQDDCIKIVLKPGH